LPNATAAQPVGREQVDDALALGDRGALAPAAPTPTVRLHDTAGQHRTIWLEPLPHDLEPELVEASERGQGRASKGSVRHVEVFQMGGVGTTSSGDLDA
jgi:hypothetical protein